MDQVKIGKFIAECRKKQGLKQIQLAEKLGITDKAVSKWERGIAMPDSSIMLELCGILNITVNDLLSGEVVTMENYNKEMEERLLELIKAKEDADKRAPYIPYERVIPGSDRYTDYVGNLVVGSDIYTIKKGHVDAPTIVKIDKDGKEHRVSRYANDASDLKSDPSTGMISWSEGTPDERWTLKAAQR